MSDRYATARVPYARAMGAPSAMQGTYDGAELATRSSRPGAYDALACPSLVNGKPRPRVLPPQPAAAPPAAATPSARAPAIKCDLSPLPPPEPEPELATPDAEAELETRRATLAVWQSYVSALQARVAFDALARRLRPFIPTENMPAL